MFLLCPGVLSLIFPKSILGILTSWCGPARGNIARSYGYMLDAGRQAAGCSVV